MGQRHLKPEMSFGGAGGAFATTPDFEK